MTATGRSFMALTSPEQARWDREWGRFLDTLQKTDRLYVLGKRKPPQMRDQLPAHYKETK